MLPTLVRRLQDADTVVFHCALSQQRGPGAALRYMRVADEQRKKKQQSEAGKKQTETQSASEGAEAGGAEDRLPSATGQTVYVLDRGFVGWQELHGEDARLTEGFRKELWRDY